MKVKQIREIINSIPQSMDDCDCVIQIDAEGNGYHTLEFVDQEAIIIKDGYHKEIYNTKWSWEEACMDSEKEWQRIKRENPKCVVFS